MTDPSARQQHVADLLFRLTDQRPGRSSNASIVFTGVSPKETTDEAMAQARKMLDEHPHPEAAVAALIEERNRLSRQLAEAHEAMREERIQRLELEIEVAGDGSRARWARAEIYKLRAAQRAREEANDG